MREIIILHLLILSGIDDLRNCRISNSIIMTGAVSAMLYSGYSTVRSVSECIFYMVVTIVIAWPLFLLGGIGAGDIKMFAVIAGFYDLHFLVRVFVIFVGVAGIVSVNKLIRQRNLIWRFKYLYYYAMYGHAWHIRYFDPELDDADATIPLAPITAIAYFGVLLINYLGV